MTCEELKNSILNNSLTDSFLVLTYPDNKFVVNQYVDEISKLHKLTKVYIESLSDINVNGNGLFNVPQNVLYIMGKDSVTLTGDVSVYKNTIVLCKEVTNRKDYSQYIVDFEKLTPEQIKEYMQVLCPGVSKSRLFWLFDSTKGDIYRIYNELRKISLFPKDKQEEIFDALKVNNNFYDLNSLTIFNFINALLKKDGKTVEDCLSALNTIDIEGTGVVTLLIRNIKNILAVQTDDKATAKSLGMSEKQFNAVKYSCGKFPTTTLIRLFEFLTNIDYRLKSGKLELADNDQMVTYITNKVMEVW